MLLENIFPFTDPVFKRYFSKKSDIEQSKMIVDMIISIIEEEWTLKSPWNNSLMNLRNGCTISAANWKRGIVPETG